MRKIFTLLLLLCSTAMVLHAQLYKEDFESGYDGWTAENIWEHGSAADNSSGDFTIPSHSLIMACNDDAGGNGNDGTGQLVSPEIDLGSLTAPALSFDAFFLNGDYQGADETARVLISTDNGATWTEVANLEGNAEWAVNGISLTPYAGQTIRISFAYSDGGGWNFGFCVDNIEISEPKAYDIALTSFNADRILMANTTVPIALQVTNLGYETINYLEVNWSDGTNTYTDMLNGLSIAQYESYTYTHDTPFTGGTEAKQYDLRAWVSSPNLQVDEDLSNDEQLRSVSFLTESAPKVVVGEEKTGTWCQWCPRGDVFLNQMIDNYPDQFIGIAVHNNDPMAIAEYDGPLGGAFPGGYPNVVMSRNSLIDPSAMPGAMAAQLGRLSPLTISGSGNYIDATHELVIDMEITSFTELRDAGLAVSVVIVEDNMTGTAGNWAQANAYSGGGSGDMGGYEDLPDPVPADQMVYSHVGRDIIGGFDGDPSLFPTQIDNGETATISMTYTVPNNINTREMHAVMLVTDPVSGEIYNAGAFRPGGIYPLFETAATRGCGPFEVNFSDMSDSTTSWMWTFEDGMPATSTEQSPTVVFTTPGYHDVTLVAVTDIGNTYTVNQEELIFVDDQSTSDFDYIIEDDVVKFDNNSSSAFKYVWDFGDGETSGSPNPQHEYAASGVYTVSLNAKNGTCEDIHTEEVSYIISGLKDILVNEWTLTASPNPFQDQVVVNYDLGSERGESQLIVYNYMGQELAVQNLGSQSGNITLGEDLPQGIFFVQIRKDDKISKMLKVTKMK